jgi:Ca2+-binding EF-hand superfamily protein
MKRPGLAAALFAATLFLAAGLRAESEMKPTASTGSPMAMRPGRTEELLKRFDKNGDGKIDDDEHAEAHETMLKEQSKRTTARGPGAAENFRRRILELFDRNKDGRLDDAERTAARNYADERGLGPDGELRQELVDRFDANADGKLDETERGAMRQALQARMAAASGGSRGVPPIRQEMLRRFDRNANGRLDDAEFTELEPVLRKRFEQNPAQLKRFDTDGDGRLSDAEWSAASGQLKTFLGDSQVAPPPASPTAPTNPAK